MEGLVLRLSGVTKHFAGVHAVENVDLVVSTGER
ncbi:MAG: ABC transporter ATP-binding protein, partial [Chloroflexota bacterium]